MTDHPLDEHEARAAVETLKSSSNPCPWRGEVSRAWRTLSMVLAVATVLASISTGFLAVASLSDRQDDQEIIEQDGCYQAIDSFVDRAAAETRRTSAAVDNLFGGAILDLDAITDAEGELLPAVREDFDEALEANRKAVIADDDANDLMRTWLNQGRPLPCPYPPDRE